MNKKWSEKTTLEKVISIVSAIALGVFFIFNIVEKKYSLQYASFVSYTAACVMCICGAISFWNVKRSVSYVAIGGTVLLIAVMILELSLISG